LLPVELLRVRIREGIARPYYITKYTRDYHVLEEVLELVREASRKQWRLDELEEKLSNLSEIYDHRLVKGLYKLLRRRVVLAQYGKLNPKDIRRQLFSFGPVVDPLKRKELIADLAGRLGVSSDDIESALFADIEGEKVVVGFRDLQPSELAAWYNALSYCSLYKLRVIPCC
jgi:predicted nuclease of restriction endonuclease-like RecB superfamily